MVIFGTGQLAQRRQAALLLTRGVREVWGLAPLPPITRAPEGKPFFSGLPDRCFNLSHSGPFALCALDTAPVGVDIQVVKRWRSALPRRVCSPRELKWLGNEEEETFWERFTLLWALKESRAKQSGRGLRGSIAAVAVPLPEEGAGPLPLDGLWFRCYAGPGWRGAACGLTPPPEEIRWRSQAEWADL